MRKWNTKFSLLKVLGLLSFGSCPNCKSFANVVIEIQFKLLNEIAMSTGEPYTCEYVTLPQSFHRGTLSLHWYIAQNLGLSKDKSLLWYLLFYRVFSGATYMTIVACI